MNTLPSVLLNSIKRQLPVGIVNSSLSSLSSMLADQVQ